jgi:hypothetical protein
VAQLVSRRPVTMETRLRSQASPFEICGGQSGNRAGFSIVFPFSAVTFSPAVIYTYTSIRLHIALIKTKGNAGDL